MREHSKRMYSERMVDPFPIKGLIPHLAENFPRLNDCVSYSGLCSQPCTEGHTYFWYCSLHDLGTSPAVLFLFPVGGAPKVKSGLYLTCALVWT